MLRGDPRFVAILVGSSPLWGGSFSEAIEGSDQLWSSAGDPLPYHVWWEFLNSAWNLIHGIILLTWIKMIQINHNTDLYQSNSYTSTTPSNFSAPITRMYLLNGFCSHFHHFFWQFLQGVQGQRLAEASAKLWSSHAWEWDYSGCTLLHGFRRDPLLRDLWVDFIRLHGKQQTTPNVTIAGT